MMMKMTFYGTRGSCAAPFPDRLEFGGNTSCVSIQSGSCWLILDGGTGIIPLAARIRQAAMAPDAAPCHVKILLSHVHLDHITGLPMFLAALPKDAEVTLYVAFDPAQEGAHTPAEDLVSLIGPPLWPVTLRDVCPRLGFVDLAHHVTHDLGDGIHVRAIPSNHPNNASIFRIGWQGREIVYGLDCEITDAFRATYVDFCRGCDVLLYDGAYSDEDYPRCVGFGHSALSQAVPIAALTGAGKVCVMHYDYSYTDEVLRRAEAEVTAANPAVCFAREGMTMELTPVS